MNGFRNRFERNAKFENESIKTVAENSINRPLAMVYPEKQSFERIFDIREALPRGTIFKDLYFPIDIK